VCKDAYDDDYPEEAEPHSFVTKTDLARFVGLLAVGPGSVLVDLGCGRGGPGLWLARETGADLIGIDVSPNAIRQADQRVAEFGLGGRARFIQADLCVTTLPDQSCDGAISIDVLMFVQDKQAIMREAGRILRPGAPFVFTAFEPRDTELYLAPLRDNRFSVEVYEEKPDWSRRARAVYEGFVAHKAALLAEMGEGIRYLIAESEGALASWPWNDRHVFVAGRRTR
jgi:ubiquinone/menaquinone biosynthesis C-methylase UbiE